MIDNVFLQNAQPVADVIVLATVEKIHADGVTLYFDGEDVPTVKRFKIVQPASVNVGCRVLCARVSGSYVVIGRIGT